MSHENNPGWAVFFDGHAPEYDDNIFTKNTVAEVDFLVEILKLEPGLKVLDVGCGTGRHAVELARRGFQVTGIDLSAGMLAEARKSAEKQGVEVAWIQADAQDFTLEERFDAAICLCEGAFGLLGSTDDPVGQPLAILRNLARSLNPGAGCLLTVLSAYRLARLHDQAAVAKGTFDPLTVAEKSEVPLTGSAAGVFLRERAFVPTEMVLLLALAGIEVTDLWGGTAGNWGRRPVELDEYEIMVVGRKSTGPVEPPFPVFARD